MNSSDTDNTEDTMYDECDEPVDMDINSLDFFPRLHTISADIQYNTIHFPPIIQKKTPFKTIIPIRISTVIIPFLAQRKHSAIVLMLAPDPFVLPYN